MPTAPYTAAHPARSARPPLPNMYDQTRQVTCPWCRTSAPAAADPRFAGYLALHSAPNNWRIPCVGSYRPHGGTTAERTTEPGWMPLAHLRAGDVIQEFDPAPSEIGCQRQVLYVRPYRDRVKAAWLIECGTGGLYGTPGYPVCLVRVAPAPLPEPHVSVRWSNAIGRGSFSRCFHDVEQARAAQVSFWPFNNTRTSVDECWRPGCFD
jgi:hypothetical protein